MSFKTIYTCDWATLSRQCSITMALRWQMPDLLASVALDFTESLARSTEPPILYHDVLTLAYYALYILGLEAM